MANLIERKIADVAHKSGWRQQTIKGQSGWTYPTWGLDGRPSPSKRWKNADSSASPKYLWIPARAERPTYYALPGTAKAISAANNHLIICTGEVDVLSLHAAGISNCLSWYGEGSIPGTLLSDLETLGVTHVDYYADNDDPGLAAGGKLSALFEHSSITCDIRGPLGFEVGYDINAAWLEASNIEQFLSVLKNAPIITFDAAEHPSPLKPHHDTHELYDAWVDLVEQEAVARWGISEPNASGYSKHFLSPARAEKNPSAQWNYRTHGFYDFGDDTLYNTHGVAALLGVEKWMDYKSSQTREFNETSASTPIQPEKPRGEAHSAPEVLIVSSGDARKRVADWHNQRDTPNMTPFWNPYKPMHQFGGLARLFQTRTVALIIAASGMGKTSFIETIADGLAQDGIDWVAWGPEWSPESYEMRRICALGGPSVERQMESLLWYRQRAGGLSGDDLEGTPLTDKEMKAVNSAIAKADSWPGTGYYLDNTSKSLEARLEALAEFVFQRKLEGRQIRAVFWDYVHKESLKGNFWG